MDIFDKLHNMSFEDRVAYAKKIAEKYGYDFENDHEYMNRIDENERDVENMEQLAYHLAEDKEPLTFDDACELLFLCMFEEVGNEPGHVLADRILLRVMEKEIGKAAHQLITMWCSVCKWYA